jgi:hypothetical protein
MIVFSVKMAAQKRFEFSDLIIRPRPLPTAALLTGSAARCFNAVANSCQKRHLLVSFRLRSLSLSLSLSLFPSPSWQISVRFSSHQVMAPKKRDNNAFFAPPA